MSYFQRRGFLPRFLLFVLRFLGLKKKYGRKNKDSDFEQILKMIVFPKPLTQKEIQKLYDEFKKDVASRTIKNK